MRGYCADSSLVPDLVLGDGCLRRDFAGCALFNCRSRDTVRFRVRVRVGLRELKNLTLLALGGS